MEERVGEIFRTVGENPCTDEVIRTGTKRTDYHRPVLVKFRSTAAAAGVLMKSQGLRKSEKFNKVFISPDRTIVLRAEHRRLVSQMKERAAEDNSLRFFIRDGQVQSAQRDQGPGEGEERIQMNLKSEFIRVIVYQF